MSGINLWYHINFFPSNYKAFIYKLVKTFKPLEGKWKVNTLGDDHCYIKWLSNYIHCTTRLSVVVRYPRTWAMNLYFIVSIYLTYYWYCRVLQVYIKRSIWLCVVNNCAIFQRIRDLCSKCYFYSYFISTARNYIHFLSDYV